MPNPAADPVEEAIRDYVLTKARLGIYDPIQPRRPAVEVTAFDVEMLEFDEERRIAHAAGPVILKTPNGDLEQFLRVSITIDTEGRIPEDAEFRAAYIVETDPASGACKETAALANA